MNAQRFAEVERVCQAALDLPDGARNAFLDEACKGDADLRAEVASLLAVASGATLPPNVADSSPPPTLTIGQRLGPYEVTGTIGGSGMGEVYEARDTRLHRTVAIKILPCGLSADPGRRARFEQEARIVAGLNHPHICVLYDVGDHEGATFLVMEYLSGETLAARLKKGPLPLDLVLDLGAQIADALSTAHRHAIVHRDLKPANVMLTKAGAKLLDFGLAKLRVPGLQPAVAGTAVMPTQTAPLTGRGMIVGTLQHMAPEQLEGRDADARADLWALGAILYEMVTGRRAFEGTSSASLIGNIMNAEPPALTTPQPLTPPGLERLVRRCLAKAPDDRSDTAHDVADELRWLCETSGVVVSTAVPRRRWRALRVAGLAAGGLALLLAATGVGWWARPPARQLLEGRFVPASVSPDDREVVGIGLHIEAWRPEYDIVALRFDQDHPSAQSVIATPATERSPALSPDGRWLAYASDTSGRNEVYLRPHPGPGPAVPLSLDGGDCPAWHPNGHEVFFLSPTGQAGLASMMTVEFTPGSPPRIGRPRVLYTYDSRVLALGCAPIRCYDVAPDGERFYGVQWSEPVRPPVVTHVNLIPNWFEELKAKVPVAR